MTFIRFTHFIVALSVLLEEAGKMCLFRRKIHYLYLPVCFITQQPMASALFKDWQHRCLQAETLTRLENTLQIEPKHSAPSCEDFTLDKYSGHRRKHSFHLLPFFPEHSQTKPPTLPSLNLELFLHTGSPCLWAQTFQDMQGVNKKQRINGASWPFFLSCFLLISGWVLQGVLP